VTQRRSRPSAPERESGNQHQPPSSEAGKGSPGGSTVGFPSVKAESERESAPKKMRSFCAEVRRSQLACERFVGLKRSARERAGPHFVTPARDLLWVGASRLDVSEPRT